MSRIGKMPIAIPAGVTVDIAENNKVTVKGPKGTLERVLPAEMEITLEGAEVLVKRPNDLKRMKSLHGLTRTLINNMVVGVTEGYTKTLEVVGVGYKVAKQGNKLLLYVGHSLVNGMPQDKFAIAEPEGITFEVADKVVPPTITVKGISKQQVGQVAAVIRGKRPPEPYHAKGIRYQGEVIRRKAGKAGKSK